MTARMNREILLSILRHLLTAGGGAVVTSGTLSGAEVEQGIGALLTLAGLVWSVIEKRAKARAAADASLQSSHLLVLVGLLPAALMLAGCASLAPDADPIVVRAEQSISISYETANGFVEWEEANRASVSEDVTDAADTLRADFPAAHRAALDALAAYKADRSAYAKDRLLQWLSTLAKFDEIARRARGEIAQP